MIVEGKSLELFAYTAWMVWNQRNKTRLHSQAILFHQVAERAKEVLAQYRENLQVPNVLSNNQWQWRDEVEMPASWVGENKF